MPRLRRFGAVALLAVLDAEAPDRPALVGLPGPATRTTVPAGPRPSAFAPVAGGFRATAAGGRLTGRFDDAGAHLSVRHGGASISLHTARPGAGGAKPAAPSLRACPQAARTGDRCASRLEYAFGDVTEWWEPSGTGFEQGWTLARRPAQRGAVRIDVVVGDASAEQTAGGVALHGEAGSDLVVGDLRGWDARGKVVPVQFERADDGFAVVVDDEGAVYPIVVDPLYTVADWEVVGSGGFGASSLVFVAAAGDTNGDGYEDVLLRDASDLVYLYEGGPAGAPVRAIASASGVARGAGDVDGDGFADVVMITDVRTLDVYMGGPSGLSTTSSTTVSDPDAWNSAGFEALSGAGDVDADGYDDVVAGAPHYDLEVGRVYLYRGGPAGLAVSPATTFTGDYSGANLGTVVSDAGDVNGDGFADVATSTPEPYGSAMLVYPGSADGLQATGGYSLGSSLLNIGSRLAAAGDVNADGYDDLIVGTNICWGHCHDVFWGEVSVVLGAAADTGGGTTLEGTSSTEFYANDHVAGAGDVNGDGYDDVQVGDAVYLGGAAGIDCTVPHPRGLGASLVGVAPVGDNNTDGYDDFVAITADSATIYLGSEGAELSTSIPIYAGGDALGAALANAGDVNGDGYEDVVVGAPGHDVQAGEALVYLGSGSGLATAPTTDLLSASRGARLGFAVAGAGDTNGDGFDDLVVGAPGDEGAAYVYLGSATGIDPTPGTAIDGESAGLGLGYRVAGVSDVNGDGYADVAVGMAPGSNYVRLYAGTAAGVSTGALADLAFLGEPSALASAGDLDGDGLADVAVGLGGDDAEPGAVQVFLGSAEGPSSATSATISGEAVGDHFGYAVSAAGDVDGDGYDDLAVGATGSEAGAGRVYVFVGGPGGVETTSASAADGDAEADALGTWVGPAGDVDGDGYDDVLAAAPGADGGGAVRTYSGSATGLSPTARSSATGFRSLAVAVATADVNRDGLLDYLASDVEDLGSAGRASAWYGCVDADLDGFCAGTDCDDADPTAGALFEDADGDGFGDPAKRLDACVPGPGSAMDATDCDDTNGGVNPGADEQCDDAAVDEDCDGAANGADSVDAVTWYEDLDGDGYTNPAQATTTCVQPDGYGPASDQQDCDDEDEDVYPGAPETCDELDSDCDGLVDEGSPGMPWWYADLDGDGYSDAQSAQYACFPPAGFGELSAEFDCDDTDPDIHPGAGDPPGDGIDQNCNGRDTPGRGCGGCSTAGSPASWLTLPLLLTLRARRRRRPG